MYQDIVLDGENFYRKVFERERDWREREKERERERACMRTFGRVCVHAYMRVCMCVRERLES